MRIRTALIVMLAGILPMVAATRAAPASAAGMELQGAGSTFVAPLLKHGWIAYFQNSNPDVVIHYDAVGSGEGVSRFLSRSVDFAATDNFLLPDDAKKIAGGVVQVPSSAGMIMLAYNLTGIKGQLNLPQDVYADIFLGKIRSWNDPRIRAANKDFKLPSINIDNESLIFALKHINLPDEAPR